VPIFNYNLFNNAVSCSYTKRRIVQRLDKMKENGLVKNMPETFPQGLRKTTKTSGYLMSWPSFKPPTSKIQAKCAVLGYNAASSGNLLPRIHVINYKTLGQLTGTYTSYLQYNTVVRISIQDVLIYHYWENTT
jgi:hypothetical protein